MTDRESEVYQRAEHEFGDDGAAEAVAPEFRALAAHAFVAGEEALSLGDEFEAELELLMAEESGQAVDEATVDAQLRQLQRALMELDASLTDAQLDAEEAMLDALLAEDAGVDLME